MTDARNIMAPHKEQDGWVYVRVRKLRKLGPLCRPGFHFLRAGMSHRKQDHLIYAEDPPESRTVSSRRVERDVETGDFLRVCRAEGLDVRTWCGIKGDLCYTGEWWAIENEEQGYPTLRIAYFRYKAAHHD